MVAHRLATRAGVHILLGRTHAGVHLGLAHTRVAHLVLRCPAHAHLRSSHTRLMATAHVHSPAHAATLLWLRDQTVEINV